MSANMTRPVVEPHRPVRLDWTFLAGCLGLALAFQLAFFQGVHFIDDFNYLRHAAEVWKGRFHFGDVLYWHGLRVLVFVPVSVAFALFGASEMTAVLWPLLATMLTIVIAYMTGLLVHSRLAAVLTALILAFLPMTVLQATRVLPEAILNLVLAASAYSYFRSELPRSRYRSWLLMSGVAFGAVPWAGHLGLVFAPFFVIAVLFLRRRPLLAYWPLALGVAAVSGMAMAQQWLSSRDPFANVDVARFVLTTESATPKPLFYLKLLVWPLASHGGVLYLAAVGAVAAFWTRNRSAILVVVWFVATYVLMEFGSSDITEYRPLFKQTRYVSILAVPGAILAAIGLAEVREWTRRRLAGLLSATILPNAIVVVVMTAAVALAVLSLRITSAWGTIQRRQIHEIRDTVREHEGEAVYTMHWLWNTRVGFFTGFDDAYFPSGYEPYHALRPATVNPRSLNRYVQELSPGEPMARGILIVDETLVRDSLGPRRTGLVGPGEIPGQLRVPGRYWPLLRRVGRIVIYEVPGGVWPEPPSDLPPPEARDEGVAPGPVQVREEPARRDP